MMLNGTIKGFRLNHKVLVLAEVWAIRTGSRFWSLVFFLIAIADVQLIFSSTNVQVRDTLILNLSHNLLMLEDAELIHAGLYLLRIIYYYLLKIYVIL